MKKFTGLGVFPAIFRICITQYTSVPLSSPRSAQLVTSIVLNALVQRVAVATVAVKRTEVFPHRRLAGAAGSVTGPLFHTLPNTLTKTLLTKTLLMTNTTRLKT